MTLPGVPTVPGLDAWLSRNVKEHARVPAESSRELRDLLMTGLTQKYNAPTNSIEKEVDRFMSTGRASQANLDRLERHVQHRAARTGEEKAESVTTALTDYSVATKTSVTWSVRSQPASNTGVSTAAYTPRLRPVPEAKVPGTPRSSISAAGRSVAGQQDNSWSAIAKYARNLEKQDETRKKEGIKEMKSRMRAELDQQMKEKRERAEQDKQEEVAHFKAQQGEWEQWGDLEKEREELRRAKAANMKKEREEQVIADRKFREEQIRKKKEEEQDLMNKIKGELDKEKKKLEEQKLEKKMYMNKILHDSEQERQNRKQKAREDSQAEMDRCRAFNRALDEQDDARRKDAEAKEQEQKQNLMKVKILLEAQARDSGQENERNAAEQKREADGRAMAIMQEREDRLKEMRQQNQAFLLQQMEENKMRKQQEAELDEVHAMIQGAENRAFLDLEKQASVDRRNKNVAHRLEIQKQITEKKTLEDKEKKQIMSDQELAMNREVLQCANEVNAQFVEEVPIMELTSLLS